MRHRLAMTMVGAVVTTSALTACTSDEAPPDDGSAPIEGDADAPAEMEFWAWAPDIAEVVDIWNQENPDQQVTVSEQAAGDELVTRVLTAAQAGNAPCLMQTEYQALPVLVSNGVVADITSGVDDIRDEFPEGAWGLTSFGEQTFSIPQDIAPMMLFYREDIFNELGLEAPTTWDQFADVAAQVRAAGAPNQYLTTFSSEDPGWFAGLSQQAQAEWWSTDGETWSVNIDAEPTQRVAEYWGNLISEDLVDDQPMYSPEWNAAMNDGTLLAWPTAVWGAGVLEGVAPDTAGLWRAVPMPQWSEGEDVTGYWGGSGTAVSADCDSPAQALGFAKWLNTSPEAVEALINISGIYPAATSGQTGDALSEPPAMLPDQADFYEMASDVAANAQGFTWGPNVNVTYNAYRDAFQAAIEAGAPLTEAVAEMQEVTVADLEQSGFEVTE